MNRFASFWANVGVSILATGLTSSGVVADPFANPSSWTTYNPSENGVGSDPIGFGMAHLMGATSILRLAFRQISRCSDTIRSDRSLPRHLGVRSVRF